MKSIFLAFAVFSRIPMPMTEWNEKNRRFILAAFPLIGASIGLALWLWQLLCAHLACSSILWAALCALIPLFVTGGIHMDGFADTVDARASHAPVEKKRQILKDPNSGAFAVIAVGSYLLLHFALLHQLPCTRQTVFSLALIHMFSRTFSGLVSLFFPGANGKGLLSAFRESANARLCGYILTGWMILLSIPAVMLLGWYGILLPAASLLMAAYVYRVATREFGGMSGDLSGYFLQLAEMAMLILLVLMERGLFV